VNNPNNSGANPLLDWPIPDEFARNQSRLLVEIIHEDIKENDGRLGFERFMQHALYEPGLGYYSGGARKFGVDGDFTTAPEISSLFSACLARQCEQLFSLTGTAVLLELGAGTGVMAADILAELQRRNSLPDKYLILETSADLRQRQQQLLQQRHPDIFARIGWLDTLPSEPINGVILANEVLDALPVRRIKIENNRFFEQMVTSNKQSFAWLSEPASAVLAAAIGNNLSDCLADLPDGYVTEYNTLLPAFIQSVSDVLGNGAMLFLDYGYPRREYYHPQRNEGTLLCHYRHRSHSDPFINIGIQDITAAVDFTLVAEAATIAGLEIAGYTTQAGFLIACGIEEIINDCGQGDDMASLRYLQQARQLLLPGQMGESFKVIALSRNIETPLQGFEFANQVQRL